MAIKFDGSKLDSMLRNAHEKDKAESKGVQDDRFWKQEKAKDNEKALYIVRPLPSVGPTGIRESRVKFFEHSYKSPTTGKFVYEKCPKTLQLPCPICEYSSTLYNSTDEMDKKAAFKYFKRTQYVINILVVKEFGEKRDDNVGGVYLWKFGKKINTKFDEALFAEVESDSIQVFHPVDGYNFNLVVTKQNDFPNYDSSSFSRNSTPIAKKDSDMNAILESTYDIEVELLDPSIFKSYEVLQALVAQTITGNVGTAGNKSESADEDVPSFDVPSTDETENTTESTDDDDFIAELEKELLDT